MKTCQGKGVSHIVSFHLYEMSGRGKSIETVAEWLPGSGGGIGNELKMGSRYLSGVVGIF